MVWRLDVSRVSGYPRNLSLGGCRDDEHRFLVIVHEDLDPMHAVEQHRRDLRRRRVADAKPDDLRWRPNEVGPLPEVGVLRYHEKVALDGVLPELRSVDGSREGERGVQGKSM